MHVGIYLNTIERPEMGGTFTFQDDLIEALSHINSDHRFFFFSGDCRPADASQHMTHVPLFHLKHTRRKALNTIHRLFRLRPSLEALFKNPRNSHLPEYTRSLKSALHNHQIEIMWFLQPRHPVVDIPFVTTVWDLAHRMMPMFPEVRSTGWTWEGREAFYSQTLPRAAYVISGTAEGKRQIHDFYKIPQSLTKVFPLPTPSFALRSASEPTGDPPTPRPFLFYPAQFWPHKNHVLILHALKRLHERQKDKLVVVFAGSDKGNLQFVERKAAELGLQDCAIFPGFVSREELISYYCHALALVFPTFFGPDNLPPLEAFALGCPVIASDIPGAREQLGDAALLVDPTDDEAWVQAIIRVMTDQATRKDLILKGSARARQWSSNDYAYAIDDLISQFGKFRRCWSRDKTFVHL